MSLEQKKKQVVAWFKVLVIVILILLISALAFMQWKSDVILRKVLTLVESRMQDSLQYENISLEWLRYFPCAALELEGLQVGSTQHPFILHSDVDVVIRLFPLLDERIVVNKLNISGGDIYITQNKGRWSYDVLKKPDSIDIQKAGVRDDDSLGWQTVIRHLHFDRVNIHFDDHDGLAFTLAVPSGQIDGHLGSDLIDAEIEMDGSVESFHMSSYSLAEPFSFEMTSGYQYKSDEQLQLFEKCHIRNKGLVLECDGYIRDEPDRKWVDINIKWNDGDPQVIKKLMPSRNIRDWDQYEFSGNSEGQLAMKGYSSEKEEPHITFSSELKDGTIKFPGDGGQLKNMLLDVAYDNGEKKENTTSYLRANLRRSSFQGNSFKGNMRMDNLEEPRISADMEGALPVSLLNIFSDSATWDFQQGMIRIDRYALEEIQLKHFSSKTFIEKSEGKCRAQNVKLSYGDDAIALNEGIIDLDREGLMKINLDEVRWNKAEGENVEGELKFSGDDVEFQLKGKHAQGEVETTGSISGLGAIPVLTGKWKIRNIEIRDLLASFENFDQEFITDKNLKGKADVWMETIIPYNNETEIQTDQIRVKAAIEIKDGQLKDMKILEDFSQYVHLEDLRDIRFNTFRNYLKIENGKVFLPVSFIQSSAMNLSVDGTHTFDQEVNYNMKINAGQVIANKLRKADRTKKLKPARKSGWINMYFILSGTTSDVQYEQDQKKVISAFEQSSKMKEDLRKHLVEVFGHEVYWIEPNEWEDIPEYK